MSPEEVRIEVKASILDDLYERYRKPDFVYRDVFQSFVEENKDLFELAHAVNSGDEFLNEDIASNIWDCFYELLGHLGINRWWQHFESLNEILKAIESPAEEQLSD